MPYFFIGPLYVMLLVGLLVFALIARCIPRLQPYSGDLAVGALGTVPGFIIGNAVFWAVVVGAALLLKKPLDHATGAWKAGAAFGFAALFVTGLVLANLAGCAVGFLGGVWIRR